MQIYQRKHVLSALFVFLLSFSGTLFALGNSSIHAKRAPAANLHIEKKRPEIYSGLKCCTCRESFDKCDCKEAKEIKAYVDALLESGISKEEIFYKVAKKFSLNTILDPRAKADTEKRLIKDAGKKRPQINAEPSYFDFGKVSKKQGTARKTFRLQNQGNSVLVINNVRVSCGCISASLKTEKNKSPYFSVSGAPLGWQESIAPENFAELEVVLDLNDESMGTGKQIRDVFVSSNDPLYPQIAVRVEIEIGD
ncbi:MAG: DUF1573 domain-containing protein [Candidatus Omnitrophica bacterium]|nr:DUF1573 domain-containing protein [Candidatus Omnitrophota bacterium]